MRTVMISSPSYDGKINVWHASSLTESCKIGLTKGINIVAVYMSFDALVQRARNDIFKLAFENNVDDLVFIDCDQDWDPIDLFKLLEHDVELVAAPVPKKNDIPQYNVKILGDYKVLDNGLVEVDGVGTGFMRIRKDAIKKIWNSSEEYKESHHKTISKMVFDVKIIDGDLWSEDIVFCDRWIKLGGKVYIDPTINCGHSGEKRWIGNFSEWIKSIFLNDKK